jgi:hypothetical protein
LCACQVQSRRGRSSFVPLRAADCDGEVPMLYRPKPEPVPCGARLADVLEPTLGDDTSPLPTTTKTGGGRDVVQLDLGEVARRLNLTVNTGGGDDHLIIDGQVISPFGPPHELVAASLQTGKGDDRVEIRANRLALDFGSASSLTLGDGDDVLQGNSTGSIFGRFFGGSGDKRYGPARLGDRQPQDQDLHRLRRRRSDAEGLNLPPQVISRRRPRRGHAQPNCERLRQRDRRGFRVLADPPQMTKIPHWLRSMRVLRSQRQLSWALRLIHSRNSSIDDSRSEQSGLTQSPTALDHIAQFTKRTTPSAGDVIRSMSCCDGSWPRSAIVFRRLGRQHCAKQSLGKGNEM